MTTPKPLSVNNARFWNELCGSNMARAMGVEPGSPESLHRFDTEYFQYYDYLLPKLSGLTKPNAKTLEVGLGYGSLGQELASSGCDYTGMDIAQEPIDLMNARLGMAGLKGKAILGDFINNSFQSESFDLFVSIGCLHHTGSLKSCIDEIERILKPGGTAVIMIYNRYSYRHWQAAPLQTLASAIKEFLLTNQSVEEGTDLFPGCYDTNTKGEEAPFTEFTSKRQLKRYFKNFSSITIESENCADEIIWGKTFLRQQLRPILGRLCGLDLYVRATKI